MARGRREYFTQAPAPTTARLGGGCLLWALVPALVAGAAALAGGPAAVAYVVAFVLVAGGLPSLLRGSTRAGVSLDDEWLTEWHALGWRRRTRLDTIERVAINDDGAVVHAPGRHITLAAPLCDWLRVACECRRAIGHEVPGAYQEDAAVSLPAQEVEQWLGVEPGGTLTLPSAFHRKAYPILQTLMVAGAVFSALLGSGDGVILLPAAVIFALSVQAARTKGRRVLEVQARGTELDILTDQGWRRYAWGSCLSLAQRGLFWVIGTPQGDIWLPPGLPELERLLRAVQSSIRAREHGWAMPRMTADVSGAAISLVRPDEVAVERGISAAESDRSD